MSFDLIEFQADSATIAAAKDAIECQSACNGMGVLLALVRHITAMRTNAEYVYNGDVFNLDTATTNQHPVMVLFLDKLASLAGSNIDSIELVSKASDACKHLSEGRPAIHPINRQR